MTIQVVLVSLTCIHRNFKTWKSIQVSYNENSPVRKKKKNLLYTKQNKLTLAQKYTNEPPIQCVHEHITLILANCTHRPYLSFHHEQSIVLTNCPWISEDVANPVLSSPLDIFHQDKHDYLIKNSCPLTT